ncbi:hypothetical protein [Actinomadura sp. GTD37]|uniref:Mom family adenine methylcarbamoylation protein n=1 Tax=Actinomadura sp. GTD37 TaxID=1778030 RepID=UPI0035BF132A
MTRTSTPIRPEGPRRPESSSTPGRKDLISALRDPDIEAFIDKASPLWRRDAHRVGVAERTMETQVRLHLPALPRELLTRPAVGDVYEQVRVQAVVRSAEIGMASVDAAYEAHFSMLAGGSKVRRDLAFEGDHGYRLRLACGQVTTRAGQFIQSRLHYLRSARSDTTLEFGLFVPGAAMPIAYAAFSPVDRPYVLDALRAVDVNAEPRELLILTRMHGLPDIPHNIMSLMLGRAFKHIRDAERAKYVITAFNPMLGFEGTTFHATGFRPFALAPVVYAYDDNGYFSTRRLRRGQRTQELDVPGNLLLLTGVTRDAKRALARIPERIHRIPDGRHREESLPRRRFSPHDPDCLNRLMEYRKEIQAAWSARTAHPRYTLEYQDPADPRGQCGVASVWLARALRHEFGVESTYCYGQLKSTNPAISSVEHHCWVEIGERPDPFRTIIDLTCDQATGMEGPVLCGRHQDLAADGLSYNSVSRLRLDELPKDRVWRRFIVLSDESDTEA